VDPVPDPLLLFSDSVGNRTRASRSVVRNSDHLTTEEVPERKYEYYSFRNIYCLFICLSNRDTSVLQYNKIDSDDQCSIPDENTV
jgi:hypothetical protein